MSTIGKGEIDCQVCTSNRQFQYWGQSNIKIHSRIFSPSSLTTNGKTIVLCWIPSHVGIRDNEAADSAAKSALSASITRMNFHPPISNHTFARFIQNEWQKSWNNCSWNKLWAIRPTVGNQHYNKSLARKHAVIINRLRIGHWRLTHSQLLSGSDPPECATCQCPLTVNHFLIDCSAYTDVQNKHFNVTSMKDLFENVLVDNIISFIKEINFYNQL